MGSIEEVFEYLLFLAQLSLPIIALDLALATYIDFSFLTGIIRDIAIAGGLVGSVDQLYWMATDRLDSLY